MRASTGGAASPPPPSPLSCPLPGPNPTPGRALPAAPRSPLPPTPRPIAPLPVRDPPRPAPPSAIPLPGPDSRLAQGSGGGEATDETAREEKFKNASGCRGTGGQRFGSGAAHAAAQPGTCPAAAAPAPRRALPAAAAAPVPMAGGSAGPGPGSGPGKETAEGRGALAQPFPRRERRYVTSRQPDIPSRRRGAAHRAGTAARPPPPSHRARARRRPAPSRRSPAPSPSPPALASRRNERRRRRRRAAPPPRLGTRRRLAARSPSRRLIGGVLALTPAGVGVASQMPARRVAQGRYRPLAAGGTWGLHAPCGAAEGKLRQSRGVRGRGRLDHSEHSTQRKYSLAPRQGLV